MNIGFDRIGGYLPIVVYSCVYGLLSISVYMCIYAFISVYILYLCLITLSSTQSTSTENCEHVLSLRLHKCPYLYDEAVSLLPLLRHSLLHLEVSSCADVSEEGLRCIADLPLV